MVFNMYGKGKVRGTAGICKIQSRAVGEEDSMAELGEVNLSAFIYSETPR